MFIYCALTPYYQESLIACKDGVHEIGEYDAFIKTQALFYQRQLFCLQLSIFRTSFI